MKTMTEYKLKHPEITKTSVLSNNQYTYSFNICIIGFLEKLGFPNFWLNDSNDILGIITSQGVMKLYSVDDIIPEEKNPKGFDIFFSSDEERNLLEKPQKKQDQQESEDIYAVFNPSRMELDLDGLSLDEAKKVVLGKYDPTDWVIYKRVSCCNEVKAYEFSGC